MKRRLPALLPLVLASTFLSSPPLLQETNPSPEILYTRALAMLASPNPDLIEVANLFRQTADAGLPRAQRSLGELYRDGLGVANDAAAAITLFRKAADKGDAKAQADLGNMYAGGLGVSKDDKQAVNWFRRAAAQGDPTGQLNLGVAYINGYGVRKDAKEALSWYLKAAEQGFVLAQFALGSLYEGAPNRAMDRQQAIQWYTKALQQGFEPARAPLEALRNPRVLSTADAEANLAKKMIRVDAPLARAAKVNGVVVVDIFVDASGKVKSIEVVDEGHPLLIESAIETVRGLEYKPLLVNGQPVSFMTTVSVEYDFQ